ncbi:hypothetical protein [Variovorax sp. PMC12]|uniref:hypothetical protein n=1 Tax=Variovorax sp. PMC12 TaxID=2126319 RepID=UPI00131C8221|nr:hypothetical protein [Variovorax sp. PMC12]
MNEPIKAGDMCEVIDGLKGKESPNLGLVVKVVACVGEHSKFGRIWRCDAEFAARGQPGKDVPGGVADFAQSWLKKLPPPGADAPAKRREVAA